MMLSHLHTSQGARSSQPPARRVQRVFFAACLLLGPLMVSLVLASGLPIPWSLGIGLFALVVFLPFGAVGMTVLAMRRSPWLASLGGLLALSGFIAYGMIVVWQEELLYHSALLGGGTQFTLLYDQINADPVMNALLLVFITGHLIGPMLLGIALGRTQVIPLWATWVLILRVPLQAAGFIAQVGLTMEIFTYGLLLLGSIPIALAWLNDTDDQQLVDAKTELLP
jgi:hypothetical protein